MNRKMKSVSILLAVLIASLVLMGCDAVKSPTDDKAETTTGGTSTASTDATNQTAEQVNLSIAILRDLADQPQRDHNEKEIVQEACKAANVIINWINVPSANRTERISVLLAADLPDAFLGSIKTDEVTKNTGLFLPLNDLLEKYAPNNVRDLNKYDKDYDAWSICTWPDGNIYSLPGYNMSSRSQDARTLPIINAEWLKELNLEMPTTPDELYTVLKAFKTKDPNGNGEADEIPFTFANSYHRYHIKRLGGMWGFTDYNTTIRDKKVVPIVAMSEYRSYIEYCHMLVEEGLMDVEGFSQTVDQFKAKLSRGITGMFYGWSPYSEMTAYTDQYEYMVLPHAEGCDEFPTIFGQVNYPCYNTTMLVITKACKHPDRVLAWWDYFAGSEERKMWTWQGKKGLTWDTIDGKLQLISINEKEDNHDREYWRFYYNLGNNITPMFDEENIVLLQTEGAMKRLMITSKLTELGDLPTKEECLPVRNISDTAILERTSYESDLLAYIESFTANAIVNGINDSDWNEHLEMLNKYKYFDWIEWYQKFYDGTLK